LNKEKIKKALEVVEDALIDKDFQEWIKENEEELNHSYDFYRRNSCEAGVDFYMWCLWQYLGEDLNE